MADVVIGWRKYERETATIVQSVVDRVKGRGETSVLRGASNRIRGVSGYGHQVDVSVWSDGDLFLIECKYLHKRVPLAAVLVLLGRIADIAATDRYETVVGAFATLKGGNRNAERVAAAHSIELHVVTSANDFAMRYQDHLVRGIPGQMVGSIEQGVVSVRTTGQAP